jgi:hypothetical protein
MIQSRVRWDDYAAIQAVSITRLKEMQHSPQRYRYRLDHPKTSGALTLGTAAHCATLEPERFSCEFVVWGERTESGRMSPRSGKRWDAFVSSNEGRTIITPDEYADAMAIACAVRSDPVAARYLRTGDPEVTMQWIDAERGVKFKGRADWLTSVDGTRTIVGLKTARDCRPMIFGSACAKLGYHLQWAAYFDGYEQITGHAARVVEIAVESEAPHSVVVYVIPSDVIEQGREEYRDLLGRLKECEAANAWPGPATEEQILTLPTWAYDSQDDLSDLGLVAE